MYALNSTTNIKSSRSGPNTLAAYKNASSLAQNNVSPTTVAGSGGKLSETSSNSTSGTGNTTNPNSPQSTGAASQLTGSIAFAGLTSFFAYLLI
jgi:hypothetical protein